MSEQMASEMPTGADDPVGAADPAEAADAGAAPRDPEHAPVIEEVRRPGGLRLARGVAGVVLLALSWGALLAAALLGLNTVDVPPHRHVIVRIALYMVGAVGACWLGVVALAALIAGAFCLTLAFTRRGW